MNTLQEFYIDLDNSEYDSNSTSNINTSLQQLYSKLVSESKEQDAKICDFERHIFNINKSFEYVKDEDKGTVNGLSWKFSGTKTLEGGAEIPWYWPDVEKLQTEDFEYCEMRYKECKNLFTKTEYGLMIYFGQKTNYSKGNDFKIQLCNELFNLAKGYYSKIFEGGKINHYVLQFQRTLEISFKIGEKAKLEDEIDTHVRFIYETHQNWDVTKDSTLRILLDLSCLISNSFKIFKDKVDFNKVIEKNIVGALELEKAYLWGAIYIIDKNIVIQQQLGLSQDESLLYKAKIYEKMMIEKESSDNCLVAVKFAEDALRIYQSLKDKNKIEELNQKYGELRGKIKLSEHQYEMPHEYTEHIEESIKRTLEESDEKVILEHFIYTPWYGEIEEIQKSADAISNLSLLSSMATTSILDKYGNTIETFRTEGEIKEYNFWQAYTFEIQNGTETMHHFFIEAYKLGKLRYDFIINFLEATWLNEPIIRNYRSHQVEIKPLDTLRPPLERLFAELNLFFKDNKHKFDSVTITDSLALKVESILRNICEKIDIPTFKTRQKGAEKLVMEKLIDDLLSDLKHTPENQTNFDEKDRLFIKYVLTEKFGYNLRNKVAHGLMDINEYSFGNILLLFSVIMKLTKYTFTIQS